MASTKLRCRIWSFYNGDRSPCSLFIGCCWDPMCQASRAHLG